MSDIYPKSWIEYLDIFMIFIRLLGLFLLVPAFSHRTIPATVKILFALSLSLAIYPVLQPYLLPIPESVGGIAIYVLRETVVGFLMGFIAFLTFEAIHLAAQFVGYQMGFGSVGLIDPVNHSSVSPLVPLHGWIALMLFFALDIHHGLLQLFVQSFYVTQNLGIGLVSNKPLLQLFISVSGNLFVIAVKLAAPFTFLVLAANVTVGILARMLPHMHVILFTFPVTILLGMATLYLIAPEIIYSIENVLDNILTNSVILLRTL